MRTVIDIDNIKIPSINNKYGVAKNGRLYLNKEYRLFKEFISEYCRDIKVDKPYSIVIQCHCYVDIDSFIKPLLDGLENAGVIENDRYVEHIEIFKKPNKRGKEGFLKVDIGTVMK